MPPSGRLTAVLFVACSIPAWNKYLSGLKIIVPYPFVPLSKMYKFQPGPKALSVFRNTEDQLVCNSVVQLYLFSHTVFAGLSLYMSLIVF